MEKNHFFRDLKEVGAYNAYKRNISSNSVAFNINDIRLYGSALEYIVDYQSFDWSETIEGREFWFEIYLSLRDLCLRRGEVVD